MSIIAPPRQTITTAPVEARPVQGWRDRRRFIDLPWKLYKNDPNWVPPLRGNQRELLGYRRHPFHDNAEVQTFLAWRGGEVVGRIAAIVNHEHNRVMKEKRGFFGFYESIDDQTVANALFDAALDWLAARGMETLRGPANPSMNYECGLLIEGFDSPPTFMMTYNPPYYADLFEGYGLRKTHDLLAYFGDETQLPDVQRRLNPLADQAKAKCQADIRSLNPRKFQEDVERFMDLYNRSLVAMWGFVPLPPAEMKHLAGSLKHLVIPEMAIFAEVEGVAMGAIIGLPDYNPRIKQIDGRLFPFGFLKLLRNRRGIRRIRVLSINVVPEYQRWGLGLVLMQALTPQSQALGVKEAEFSWVSEENDMARLGLEKGGAKIYKRYRMYDLEKAEDGSKK